MRSKTACRESKDKNWVKTGEKQNESTFVNFLRDHRSYALCIDIYAVAAPFLLSPVSSELWVSLGAMIIHTLIAPELTIDFGAHLPEK